MQEEGLELIPNACAVAAAFGQLEVLKWLRTEEASADWDNACALAAMHGHLEVLKWLREEASANWDKETTWHAAREGPLELLQWVVEHGCPWGGTHLFSAAYAGRADVVEWAVERGLPDQMIVCLGAAAGGHLQLLQWARGRDLYWDERVYLFALSMVEQLGWAQIAALRWALQNGCPFNVCTVSLAAMKAALRVLPRVIVHVGLMFISYCRRRVWGCRSAFLVAVLAVLVLYSVML